MREKEGGGVERVREKGEGLRKGEEEGREEKQGEKKQVNEILTTHQPLPLCPDTYVYDYRGLRVRSSFTSSIERSKPVQQLVMEEGRRDV